LLELLERLDGRLDPRVALPKSGELSKRCEDLGIPFFIVPDVWWVATGSIDAWLYGLRRLPVAVEKISEIIRREKIDVVHSNSSVSPAGALAAALESRPHVWHAREFLSNSGVCLSAEPLGFELLRHLMRLLSYKIITVSEALACEFREHGEDRKVAKIHDGIDFVRFRDYCVKENKKVLAIGASTPDKGLDELVHAAALLRDRGVEAEFEVLGNVEPDGYLEQVTRKLSQFGLSSTFRLKGYQSEIGPYLADANVFCLPSRAEGMSRVVLEAMASGLPVVATDCGGPRELVKDGVTGLLCQVNDPQGLASSLTSVISNQLLARKMGEKGRERVQAHFGLAKSTLAISKLIEEAGSASVNSEARAIVELLLRYMSVANPRVLLGKKWRFLKQFV
jgi:glycosyltransferase involved in cell wall biosynthesis